MEGAREAIGSIVRGISLKGEEIGQESPPRGRGNLLFPLRHRLLYLGSPFG